MPVFSCPFPGFHGLLSIFSSSQFSNLEWIHSASVTVFDDETAAYAHRIALILEVISTAIIPSFAERFAILFEAGVMDEVLTFQQV